MSKRKKNYPDPSVIVQNYGADALRSELELEPVCVSECLCASGRVGCVTLCY